MDLKTLISTIQSTLNIDGAGKANKYLKGIKKNGKTIITAKNINKINSIKGQARKSIAQYPVLVSENLNPKLVPILTNAIELENASLLMLVLGNVSTFNSGDVSSVLKKVHREGTTNFMDGVDNVNELYEANNALMEEYADSFNLNSINESYYTKTLWDYLTEAPGQNTNKSRSGLGIAKDVTGIGKNVVGIAKDVQGMKYARDKEIDRKKEVLDQNNRDKYRSGKGVVTTTTKDLTKVNDLQPLVVNLDVSFVEPSGQTVVDRTLSIGVKAVSHLVKSDDIAYYLSKAAYKDSKFLKVIKWTTGEIKFWRDLVFALDDVKMSVIQNSKTIANRNVFSKLEYISKAATQSTIAGVKTEDLPTAITTLIITKTDVENIKYRDGIDILSSPNYLKKIFKQYYLLNLLIVDESLEIVYRYDEHRNTIERTPFTSYEKMSKERTVNANDLLKLANR